MYSKFTLFYQCEAIILLNNRPANFIIILAIFPVTVCKEDVDMRKTGKLSQDAINPQSVFLITCLRFRPHKTTNTPKAVFPGMQHRKVFA